MVCVPILVADLPAGDHLDEGRATHQLGEEIRSAFCVKTIPYFVPGNTLKMSGYGCLTVVSSVQSC